MGKVYAIIAVVVLAVIAICLIEWIAEKMGCIPPSQRDMYY
jgi:hypothetical protein